MAEEKKVWRKVGPADAIPLREGRRAVCDGLEIAVFNLGSEFLAVENRCPHRSGPLADGIVAGRSVFCPLHNWKIDLAGGTVVAGGEGKVRTCAVRVRGGQLEAAFDAPKTAA